MKKINFKSGDEALIVSTKKTNSMFGINNDMKDMVGKIYTVESADRSCIKIQGFYWDIRDIEKAPTGIIKLKTGNKGKFDISLLEV